ncbi:HEAT repeat domain-containing protein [Fodinibius halophilus]|uniref:M1 family metallopeptidase n=1 Tax=Fodinibius halophilus TaxID=1736908 RepID=A0A6M1SYN1_9BACT|nr:HEAT repeat domain-containing protein [Fodinibius halophilus]NGP86747.1 M1 family metallopeptidase [Fodinibius halophilus]
MRNIGFSFQYFRSAIIVVLLLLIFGISHKVEAQSFDYEAYPKLDFDFINLTLDLGIQPQNLRIDGAATYEVEANISGADTLTLFASHIDISSVSVDGESADYSLHNDSLFIPVVDSAEMGQRFNVNIRYSGNPNFGLLKNRSGTVWTSMLPKAQRHWVPVVDHPNVEFKTTFNIAVPSGFQLWATGKKLKEEMVSVDVMRYQFTSEDDMPASSLAFTVGKFKQDSTKYGAKKINLATEQSLTDSVNAPQLLEATQKYLSDLSDQLQVSYPYNQLNIIVTKDHNWETKSWGASTIFLYQNRGSLELQLLRGIIGQWFGEYQRVQQWSQADALTLYQTMLIKELAEGATTLDTTETPKHTLATVYDYFGIARWNQWQKGITSWQNASIHSFIKAEASNLLTELGNVVSWDTYADAWYQEIGQPLFEQPALQTTKNAKGNERLQDLVTYKVDYELNEAEGQLKLRFEAVHGVYKDLVTITADEVYPNKKESAEVTFTGNEDAVVLQVDPMISTLQLNAPDHPELILEEYKPAPFLIYELRNGDTVEERAAAAKKLGTHAENPDLQLAIRDFMNKDLSPKVEAALLQSLGDITDGAAGTQQIFLDALKSENQAIREAGLMALQNYKGTSTVVASVKSVAQRTEHLALFQKATQVLTALMSKDQFVGFTETVVQQDSVGNRAIFVIQELANMGAIKEAIERAELFITEDYSYEIRQRALHCLIQHDHTPSDWLSRARELLEDPDPRIRFLIVEGLRKNRNKEITDYLSAYIQDEYDARVYQKIGQVLE